MAGPQVKKIATPSKLAALPTRGRIQASKPKAAKAEPNQAATTAQV